MRSVDECELCWLCFFFDDPATTEIYTLSLHGALPFLAWFHGSEGREGGRCTGEEAAPRPTLQVAVEAITHIRRLRDALTTKRDDDSASSSFMARAV